MTGQQQPDPGVGAASRPALQAILDVVLAHAPVATIVLDRDGRVLYHNDAAVALWAPSTLGPAAFTASDNPALASFAPELAAALEPIVADVVSTGSAGEPADIGSGPPDARRAWQASGFPIRYADRELFGVGLIFADVTREREASQSERDSRARLDLSLVAGGMGTWEWDLAAGRLTWSGGLGLGPDLGSERIDLPVETVLETIDEADRDRTARKMQDSATTGADFEDEFRVRLPDGEARWIECRGRALTSGDGTPQRVVGVAMDVTDRRAMEAAKLQMLEREHQARVAAESSRERLALLAEVSGSLASVLEPFEVHRILVRLLVPRLADWCILDTREEDGSLREAAVAHIDPGKVEMVREARRWRKAAGGDGLWSVRRAMRTGRAERVEEITDDDLVAAASEDAHLELLRALAPRSAVVAPLVSRGRVVGGITLVTTAPRSFDADDQALVENIAHRAATAIDTAMLFDLRTEVARALQQNLLPPALPEIPGIDLGARYRVAESGIEIGGDFYDVFETSGTWHVVVGDVCGKGPAAAAVTGLLRHTLRAVAPPLAGADSDLAPASILAATNEAILGQVDDTRFATAVLVSLRPHRGGAEVSLACGGHPRPVLVRADGAIERVECTGTLLGVLPDPDLDDVRLDLAAGDALVLFTDGVTEARQGPLQFGDARLMEVLDGSASLHSAVEVADRVVQAVDEFRDPDAVTDDIAVVAIRVPSLDDV